ncbi:YolD-like family protein [Cytobacillus kochii]|uniref:YolD-like family protein n=1 Tax=Cytobacillus kochii TaxID=859143 RepID=UPI00203D632A|nr:YolD-like family protein [Cytobacillus kochii]MCM3324220.1 YolD-like family protein [Cytobacillus kochii]MCM3346711.1 YolD-like family protein [Cytobacillus kochii]
MGVKMPKKSKPQRPSRDEFELEELGNAVVEAHREKTEVLILLWQRDPIQGKIIKLDGQSQLIHIESDYETIKVKFIDILSIQSAPQ